MSKLLAVALLVVAMLAVVGRSRPDATGPPAVPAAGGPSITRETEIDARLIRGKLEGMELQISDLASKIRAMEAARP